MSFKEFDLDSRVLKAIEEAGYHLPTPIQANAIPEIIKGSDLRASAQTGTGKTAAFLLPILHRIASNPVKFENGPRVLILAPTRELAMQIAKESEKQSKYLPRTKTVCIYGGEPYPVQKRVLSRPYEILVATPGRLIDFLEQGKISLAGVEVLVLDEADRMLDMGFIEPVEHIAAATPASRQTLLFSATMKGQVLNLSKKLLKNPCEINVIPADEKHDCIEQNAYFVDDLGHKLTLIKELLRDPTIKQALIFTSTKQYAEELSEILGEEDHAVGALHGDMNQRQRARTLANLRAGKLQMIVATDVAARGIDVSTISHVFNFDLPRGIEDYTHRIGRTGRAGAQGIAISFVSPKEHYLLKQIEAFIKQKIAVKELAGFEAKLKGESKRSDSRRSGSGSRDRERRPFPKRNSSRPPFESSRKERDFDQPERRQSSRPPFESKRDFDQPERRHSRPPFESKRDFEQPERRQASRPPFESPRKEFDPSDRKPAFGKEFKPGAKPHFKGPTNSATPFFKKAKPEFKGEGNEFKGAKPQFRKPRPEGSEGKSDRSSDFRTPRTRGRAKSGVFNSFGQ